MKFLNEINKSNSSLYKLEILNSFKNDDLEKRILKMTYDKVAYTYGVTMLKVTMKNVTIPTQESKLKGLEYGLNQLERLNSREVTGNKAIKLVEDTLSSLNEIDRDIIIKILDRDLKINIGRTLINKVHKGLIIKPSYMRCNVLTQDRNIDGKPKKGTSRNINYPALVQKKADGTYREFGTEVVSRSGESYTYPEFEEVLAEYTSSGRLLGEMTLILDTKMMNIIIPKLEKIDKKNGTDDAEVLMKEFKEHQDKGIEFIAPRGIGNGILNSDDIPYENVVFDVWDYVKEEDYVLSALKDKLNKPKIPYIDRFEMVKDIIGKVNHPRIRVIESKEVNSLKEAYEFSTTMMNDGFEGAVLKDKNNIFKDGTANDMLKVKLIVSAEFRVCGFIEGKKGTKREKTFGSLTFESKDGKVKGSTSGFTDEMLDEINSDREGTIGRIIEVEFNEVSKGRGNDYYALSHPRFKGFRVDKTEADDLDKILEMQEMAKEIKDII